MPSTETPPYTPEEILGHETPETLRLVNRLYSLGAEIRKSDDLSEALAECIKTLTARVRRGEDEAMAFQMSALTGSTIRELHELNREGCSWALGVLFAIVECGIETARHPNARLACRTLESADCISLEYAIVDGEKCIGRISLHRDIDGSCKWVSTARLRTAEWGQPWEPKREASHA